MVGTQTLSRPDQIKALTNPLRQRILGAMIQEPITTKQVSVLLSEKPTRLYHHVDALERAGLIRLSHTRQNRGTVEKYFQAVAHRFVVDRKAVEVNGAAGGEGTELEGVIAQSLDATLSEIRDGISSGVVRADKEAGDSVFIRSHLRASPLEMSKLIEKLQEWIRECQRCHDPEADLEYGLTLAFYPTSITP
ncbi:MAG: helix-turn-helix domain-containing protein [Acidobacteriota bacterium]